MSDSILEKSLDEIIGTKNDQRSGRISKGSGGRGGARDRRAPRGARPSSALPRDIQGLAGSRPVLRIRNVHAELNGEDLSNLFGTITPVDFVKFDNNNDSIAYVCFQRDNTRSNAEAVAKYDGKKAMGEKLVVENATSLADRILSNPRAVRDVGRAVRESREPRDQRDRQPRRDRGPRREREPKKERKPRPEKKSADDLDAELSAYMNNDADKPKDDSMSIDP